MSHASSGNVLSGVLSEKADMESKSRISEDGGSGSTEIDDEAIEPDSVDEMGAGLAKVETKGSRLSRDSKTPGLSRVVSRITTHSITDLGPPPDGGLKAWTQCAMSWLAILATWGWVNCFGNDHLIYKTNNEASY